MTDSFPPHTVTPAGYREFARVFGSAATAGRPVRLRGGGTKLGWGGVPPSGAMRISTARLTEASFTDTTATFGAGTPLARVHTLLARRGRMLALDPPLARGATLGGVLATADSGPLQHGYGSAREQLVDLLAALPDGSLVRASENAEDDLCSLLTGSYGTLAAILEATVVTHPLPSSTTTVLATSSDSAALAAAAAQLADGPVRIAALDYAWHNGAGGLLALLSDTPSEPMGERLDAIVELVRGCGIEAVEVRPEGDSLWARQRAGQRSPDRAVLRVRHARDLLPQVLAVTDQHGATAVGRAALSCAYLTADVNQLTPIRQALPVGCHATVTDLPAPARGAVESWAALPPAALELMRALKQRFDPTGACNPGVFVNGI